MKVLVDTSVWSLALRRAGDTNLAPVRELRQLIADGRVQMLGAIRQELLSGIRDETQFKQLKSHLAAFPDLAVTEEDHVMAARFFNEWRRKGIQGSNTDFLICAIAVRHRLAIFATDKEFVLYAKHLPIVLHK